MKKKNQPTPESFPIYVISGGSGVSGEQLVQAVVAQFPKSHIPVTTISDIRTVELLENAIVNASVTGGIIAHTLVDKELRKALVHLARKHKMDAIDLMGPLIENLSQGLNTQPVGQPGLYHQLHRDYFERIEAIEFAVTHDDGKRPQDVPRAEIVLIGVSRCGKTPLSMYLAVLGWKVANIPVVPDLPLSKYLFQADRGRVIGLSIAYERLLLHRQRRQERMGNIGDSAYTKPSVVFNEIEVAHTIFKKHGFTAIDVTNKPIESSADEIIELMSKRFKKEY